MNLSRVWQILGLDALDKLKNVLNKCFISRRSPPGLSIWLTNHFEQRIAGLEIKDNPCCAWGNRQLLFSRPPKVEVFLINEPYRFSKNPLNCIKSNYSCWKQSRQFVSHVVENPTKSTSIRVIAFSDQRCD